MNIKVYIGKNGSGKTRYFEKGYFNSKRLSQFTRSTNNDGRVLYLPASSLLNVDFDLKNAHFFNFLKENSFSMNDACSYIEKFINSLDFTFDLKKLSYNAPSNWADFDTYIDEYIKNVFGNTNSFFVNTNSYKKTKSFNEIASIFKDYTKTWIVNNKTKLPEDKSDFFHGFLNEIIFDISNPVVELLELASIKALRSEEIDFSELNNLFKLFNIPISFSIIFKENHFAKTAKPTLLLSEEDFQNNWTLLSTGQKVLANLICQIFLSSLFKTNAKIIIFDEVFTFLNIDSQIEIMSKINKINQDIIVITHSPITISSIEEFAVLNDSQIEYHLIKDGEPKKIQKQEAINELLRGVQNIKVGYYDQILLFAESKNDAFFYEWQMKNGGLACFNNQSVSTEQYTSGAYDGDINGGITKIDHVAEALKNIENINVAFIKDWDGKNLDNISKKTYVVNNRYSLENYLYDPFFLSNILKGDILTEFKDFYSGDELTKKYIIDGKAIDFPLPTSFLESKLKGSDWEKHLWEKYKYSIKTSKNFYKSKNIVFTEVKEKFNQIKNDFKI